MTYGHGHSLTIIKPYCWVTLRHPELAQLDIPARVPWPENVDCRLNPCAPLPLDALLQGIELYQQDPETDPEPSWNVLASYLHRLIASDRIPGRSCVACAETWRS